MTGFREIFLQIILAEICYFASLFMLSEYLTLVPAEAALQEIPELTFSYRHLNLQQCKEQFSREKTKKLAEQVF